MSKRILIVEDDAGIRQVLNRYLTLSGVKCHAVDSGEAAVDFLQKEQVDAAIIDLRLLGSMSGLDLINWLHANTGTKDVEIIVITADNRPGVREEVELAGITTYVMKPFDTQFMQMLNTRFAG